MSSTFADTHNMFAILTKSDASEGFDQILDFLNGSYIQYALAVNPYIYVSCIKQFWNTATVKQSADKESIACQMKRFLLDWLSLSAKRTSWNEFSSANASAVICLSTCRKFNFSKYIFDSLVKNIDSSSKFYMYTRVRKGFSRVETPLFEGMIVVKEHMVESIADEQVQDDATITTAPKDVTAVVEEDIQAQIIPSPAPPTSPPP
nr:hypothetical protein [Tanacetum cinerariifolium]